MEGDAFGAHAVLIVCIPPGFPAGQIDRFRLVGHLDHLVEAGYARSRDPQNPCRVCGSCPLIGGQHALRVNRLCAIKHIIRCGGGFFNDVNLVPVEHSKGSLSLAVCPHGLHQRVLIKRGVLGGLDAGEGPVQPELRVRDGGAVHAVRFDQGHVAAQREADILAVVKDVAGGVEVEALRYEASFRRLKKVVVPGLIRVSTARNQRVRIAGISCRFGGISTAKGGNPRNHAAVFRDGHGEIIRFGCASLQPGRIEGIVAGGAAVEVTLARASLGIGGIQTVKDVMGIPAGRFCIAGCAAGASGCSLKAVQSDFDAVQQLMHNRIPAQVCCRLSFFPDTVCIFIDPDMAAHPDRFGQDGGGYGVGAERLRRRGAVDSLSGARTLDILGKMAGKIIDGILPCVALQLLLGKLTHVHAVFHHIAFTRGERDGRIFADCHRNGRDRSIRAGAPAGGKLRGIILQLIDRIIDRFGVADSAAVIEYRIMINRCACTAPVDPCNARYPAKIHSPCAASGGSGIGKIARTGQDIQQRYIGIMVVGRQVAQNQPVIHVSVVVHRGQPIGRETNGGRSVAAAHLEQRGIRRGAPAYLRHGRDITKARHIVQDRFQGCQPFRAGNRGQRAFQRRGPLSIHCLPGSGPRVVLALYALFTAAHDDMFIHIRTEGGHSAGGFHLHRQLHAFAGRKRSA